MSSVVSSWMSSVSSATVNGVVAIAAKEDLTPHMCVLHRFDGRGVPLTGLDLATRTLADGRHVTDLVCGDMRERTDLLLGGANGRLKCHDLETGKTVVTWTPGGRSDVGRPDAVRDASVVDRNVLAASVENGLVTSTDTRVGGGIKSAPFSVTIPGALRSVVVGDRVACVDRLGRILWIRKDGRVLSDTSRDLRVMNPSSDSVRHFQAVDCGPGLAHALLVTDKDDVMLFSYNLRDADAGCAPVARRRLAPPHDLTGERLDPILTVAPIGAGGACVLGSFDGEQVLWTVSGSEPSGGGKLTVLRGERTARSDVRVVGTLSTADGALIAGVQGAAGGRRRAYRFVVGDPGEEEDVGTPTESKTEVADVEEVEDVGGITEAFWKMVW